jgi:peptidoglycan/LPS O-acetylase OafA/YrhL
MTGSRLDHLDGLRALAALLVLCNHSWRMAWPRLQGDPVGLVPDQNWLLWTTGWARYGHFGVTLFIVVSGFCLMLPVARHGGRLRSSVGQFFLRRARRILPTYYAALACSLLLIWLFIGEKTGTQWDAQLPVTPAGVVSRLLMLQDVWEPLQINNPFWSIAVEWRIYFAFPLLVWAFQKWGPARVAAAGVAAVAVAMLIPVLLALSVGYLGMFLLGMLAASLAHGPESSPRHGRIAAIICLGAGAALLAYCLAHDFLHVSTRFRQLDFLAGLSAAAGLVFLSLSPGSRAARALRWKPLVVLGGFSYSVYLMHMPLLQLVWQYGLAPWGLSREATFFLLISLGWGLVLAGCRVFYHLFERPFLNPAAPPGPTTVRTP